MKRRTLDKHNGWAIALNTWLFACALIVTCYSWYAEYVEYTVFNDNGAFIFSFHNPVLVATIAVLFASFFFSVVIIRPHRAKMLRERELMRLKFKSGQHEEYTDSQTGLCNKALFERSLSSYFHEFKNIEEPLGVFIICVENIHTEYTDVMSEIARQLETTARDYDIIARVDTNRFAVLLPHADPAAMPDIATRYRNVLEDGPGIIDRLRVAIGFASMDAKTKTPNCLMENAEGNMLASRRLSKGLDADRNLPNTVLASATPA